jgi:peptide/nickel transport system permease protein
MARHLIRRLLVALLQLFLVGTLVFSFLHLLPGDPALLVIGSESAPSPEVVAAVRKELKLDQPLLVQYGQWVGGVLTGDLGKSLYDRRPVVGDLASRLPRTLELVLIVSLLAPIIGIPLGILAALHRNRVGDGLLSGLAATGISVPVFVTGTLLVLVFGLQLRWFPASGFIPFSQDPLNHIKRLTLPAVTLMFSFVAVLTRMTRSAILEVLRQDYVRTARAKGLKESVVIFRHVLRNALAPVITVIGLQMGSLLGGTVLVEYIFNWPGLSTLLMSAIQRRDYPVVQGVILLVSSLFITLTIVIDLMYAVINPRIRYT